MLTPFSEATAIKVSGTNVYSGKFQLDWCNGSVPDGGYVTSCFLAVAKLHFNNTRPSQNQSDTIALQLNFLRRTSNGPTIFTVTELKLGQRTSTISISLTQPEAQNNASQPAPPLVIGLFTQSNIAEEEGLSIRTTPLLRPPALPTPNFHALETAQCDDNWILDHKPFTRFTKSIQHIHNYLPRRPRTQAGLLDQWVRMANGQRFTPETLGFLADCIPIFLVQTESNEAEFVSEIKRLGIPDLNRGNIRAKLGKLEDANEEEKEAEKATENSSRSDGNNQKERVRLANPPDTILKTAYWSRFWYPTVVLSLDIKKRLPDEGVEWLFSRIEAKQIRNGRMDYQISILDEGGDLVALSNHVLLVVGLERNVNRSGDAGRMKGKGEGESKL